jgi:IS30 family transposase
MEDRQSETVLTAMTVSLQKLPCHTITLDNGKEFARFIEIEEALKTKTYFAHPHSPWERPINEHTNGLLRQFFPKNSSFQDVSDAAFFKQSGFSITDLAND